MNVFHFGAHRLLGEVQVLARMALKVVRTEKWLACRIASLGGWLLYWNRTVTENCNKLGLIYAHFPDFPQ